MKDTAKNDIARLRAQGAGYGTIAAQLDLSVNTVKSFCRRNKLQSNNEQGNEAQAQGAVCLYCGNDMELKPVRANRKFCSETCRRSWWKANGQLIDRRAFYSFTCAYCGCAFESYGNSKRKFCCHDCYIKARFQKEG